MRLLTLLTGLLMLAACGGEESGGAGGEAAGAWCCDGSWEDCRAAIDPAEASCFDRRCGDGGTFCALNSTTSFCVWSDDPGDDPSCRVALVWNRDEDGGWRQISWRCVPHSEPDSTCI